MLCICKRFRRQKSFVDIFLLFPIALGFIKEYFCRAGNISGGICQKQMPPDRYAVLFFPKATGALCLGKHLAVVREVDNAIPCYIAAQPGVTRKSST